MDMGKVILVLSLVGLAMVMLTLDSLVAAGKVALTIAAIAGVVVAVVSLVDWIRRG